MPSRRPVKIDGSADGKTTLARMVVVPGAEHARGAKQQQIGVAHAVRGVHHDRIEGAEADQKQRARVIDAEHRDGEGQPRRDRHRAQQLDRRIDQARRKPAPADHQPERNRHHCGKPEALQHPPRRIRDVVKPSAGVRREHRRGAAEDPGVPGAQHLRRGRDDAFRHPAQVHREVPQREQQERQDDKPGRWQPQIHSATDSSRAAPATCRSPWPGNRRCSARRSRPTRRA